MNFISGMKQSKSKNLFFPLIILIISCIVCVESTWCASEEGLKKEINSVLHKHKPKGSSVGISIFSISEGIPLYKLNSEKTFIVASNMKLFTTAAALVYLGPDFEYKTSISYRGSISSSEELNGDIIIKGSGDPNISGRFYEYDVTAVPDFWANSIIKRGIKTITGDIIADDSIFDRDFIRESWPQDQLSEWYCAQISGLSFNDNCIAVEVKPNKNPGSPVYVQTTPKTSYAKIVNDCKTTALKKKHLFSLYRKPLTNQIHIKGNIWSESEPQGEYITVHNPPLYAATVFKEILERNNIRIMGNARVVNDSDLNTEQELHGLTQANSRLGLAVKVTNKRSQGFYAEQILKTMGAHIKQEGSFSAGLDVIRDFITELGFSKDQYQIDDGSGLSGKNKLTPGMIIELLRFMYIHKHGRVFIDSLPVSGIDGTLENRLKEEPYKSRVRAKTGYLNKVSTLSGYIRTLDEEVIVFSILVNDIKGSTWQAKRLQNEICKLLVNYN